ncbi:MAG TPA: hypothetical protein PKC38_10460, partial [Chitinophagales bacterium]|nr:hypothetical protein [Chitinophagales bacterium]
KITLSMSLSDLNSNFLEGLSEVLKQHPGKDSIVLKVIEHTEQFDLLMRNKQGGIRAESAVLNSLGKFGEVNLTVVG